MSIARYVSLLLILLVSFLGLIYVTFTATTEFMYQFFLLLVLLVLAIIILIGTYNKKYWAAPLSTIFFIVFILNIYYIHTTISASLINLILLTFSGFGLILSVSGIKRRTEKRIPKRDEKEEIRHVPVVPYGVKEVKKEYRPGKYIASTSGTTYHSPKCDWAKKIKKKNTVWFKNDTQARAKGYKKHSCLKK